MDKLIIDPELFITCRLCLVQKGQYQIVPSVQKQIKFCFDIDVEPFDGLPQLICKDCEFILTKFNNVKANFQKKQHDLRSGVPRCSGMNENVESSNINEQDEVTSTETAEDKSDSLKFILKRKQISSIEEKNDTKKESDSGASGNISVKKFKKKKSKYSSNWRKDYKKIFSCRFCLTCYKDKKKMPKHLKTHEALLSQYKLKHCSVPLVKSDRKNNITGLPNTVVLQHDKIIQHLEPYYSVLYQRKANSDANLKKMALSDSSDDNYTFKRKAKRLRLLSGSSIETVLLEGTLKKDKVFEPENELEDGDIKTTIDCVDIESSSEPDSEKKYVPDDITRNDLTSKIISNTIASCFYKYINRCNSSENYKESLLMHKDLSLGSKIIHGKPFYCLELLRFLGYRNLNVQWVPRLIKRSNNSVQIKIKLKESVTPDSDMGWKKLSSLTIANNEAPLHDLLDKIHSCDNNFSICNKSDNACLDATILTSNETNISVQSQNDSNYQLRMLLNKSPVANPKQLPKKAKMPYNNCLKVMLGNSNSPDISLTMPIITHTVSLAGTAELMSEQAVVESTSLLESTSANNININETQPQPQLPRIKVKPVSQLMALTSSAISSTSIPNWNTPVNTYDIPIHNDNDHTQSGKENVEYDNEYVIMHTVELPNMKTASPFLYFKKLLQIHNIGLLNSTDPIPRNYVCLIKFKSIFNQDNQHSVTLGMGLFSDSQNFAIKLKDVSTGIDIKTLSPRWQWEVLQLYRGNEIVTRLLDNAKIISQKMCDATTYFIRLLRCIVFSQST